jgi:hypothetical protein
MVDHKSATESETFRGLLTYMLAGRGPSGVVHADAVSSPHRIPQKRSRQELLDDTSLSNPVKTASIGVTSSSSAEDLRAGGRDSAEGRHRLSQERFRQRTEVFESLLTFFPPDAREPSANLVDMINWYEESIHD